MTPVTGLDAHYSIGTKAPYVTAALKWGRAPVTRGVGLRLISVKQVIVILKIPTTEAGGE
jgi:hypothetical protein